MNIRELLFIAHVVRLLRIAQELKAIEEWCELSVHPLELMMGELFA